MKLRKLIITTLIICLCVTLSGCSLDLSKLNLGAFFPGLSPTPTVTPDNSPAFPSVPDTKPDFSVETSPSCPNGHELVYHSAKANCLSDGWEAYATCKNCTEYSTRQIIPALGAHDLVCDMDDCPGEWHTALHTCTNCGYGMVAKPENRYYVSKLTKTQYDVYCNIKDGIMNFEDEITIQTGLITREEWMNVLLWTLSYDSPELIQIGSSWHSSTITTEDGVFVVKVFPEYQMNQAEYQDAMLLISNTFSSWQNQHAGKSDYEIELAIHDQITSTTTYSANAEFANCTYGVLHDKLARCEGLSKTFAWAMWGFSIPCTSIVGTAAGEAHSFNAVQIDGDFTFVDITWDLGNSFSHHDYFNVSKEILLNTHSIHDDFTEMGYPDCTTMAHNYAVKNNLYFTEDSVNSLGSKLFAQLDLANANKDYVIELRFDSKSLAEASKSVVTGIIGDWVNDRGIPVNYLLSMGNNCQVMIKLN